MSFTSSAETSLTSNRKLRSSINREFRSGKYHFAVNASPKIELSGESRERVAAISKKRDKALLLVMVITGILLGLFFYWWMG